MKLLNREEYEYIRTVFRQDAELEFVLNKIILDENELSSLQASVLNITASTKLYNLFTEGAMANMVSNVFENNILRDYVLGLTDRFFCNIACIQNVNDINDSPIEAILAAGLKSNYVKSTNVGVPVINYNVTPDKVVENIKVDFELVLNVLKHNKWLVTIVLMIIFTEQVELVTP